MGSQGFVFVFTICWILNCLEADNITGKIIFVIQMSINDVLIVSDYLVLVMWLCVAYQINYHILVRLYLFKAWLLNLLFNHLNREVSLSFF